MQEWVNLYGEVIFVFVTGLCAVAIPLAGFTAYEAIKGLIETRTSSKRVR